MDPRRIGAGFVRNAVWDHLSGEDTEATPLADLDVVFHDPAIATAEQDAATALLAYQAAHTAAAVAE